MRRVWAESIDAEAIELGREEARHLRDVLRAGVGDDVMLFDGEGRERAARIEVIGKRGVRLRALSGVVSVPDPPGPPVHLLVALLRSDAMDRVVRGATELGVAAMVPIAAERSQPHPRGLERWRRIVREAARQCGRARLPVIAAPASLEEAIAALPPGRRIVLFEDERTNHLTTLPSEPGPIVLAVGPEGGWTAGEMERFHSAGFEPSGLSDAILRAETAALAAVAVVRTVTLKGGAWGA